PCIPVDPAVPFFSTTATPNAVQHAAPGTSLDYTLQGWSSAPVADWNLDLEQSGTLNVATKLSATTMNNGRTATLHVDIPADAKANTSTTLYLFSYHSADDANPWFLSIAVP